MNERMARVETKLENIENDVTEIKDLLHENIVNQNKRFDELPKKFAPKWVERTLITLLLGIALAVISFIKY